MLPLDAPCMIPLQLSAHIAFTPAPWLPSPSQPLLLLLSVLISPTPQPFAFPAAFSIFLCIRFPPLLVSLPTGWQPGGQGLLSDLLTAASLASQTARAWHVADASKYLLRECGEQRADRQALPAAGGGGRHNLEGRKLQAGPSP